MALDFANAQLPRLTPLERSFAENDVEAQLKALFLSLFDAMTASRLFDVNVLGAPHLGSFDLVRRAVNADGLVLLQGDREEAATRYLYRAWKSGDSQGRGLHFLRTYLQMLFPNQCEVRQLWQETASAYPLGTHGSRPGSFSNMPALDGTRTLDGSWAVGQIIAGSTGGVTVPFDDDETEFWLTSRVIISMSYESDTQSIEKLAKVLGSVLPARMVPVFEFWLRAVADMRLTLECRAQISRRIETYMGGLAQLVVTDNTQKQFSLGRDESASIAPRLVVAGMSGDFKMRWIKRSS